MTQPERPWPRVVAFGERALVVELGSAIDDDTNRRVHALFRHIDARHEALGVDAAVPAYASLLVRFDPARTDEIKLRKELLALATAAPGPLDSDGSLIEISVRYGGDDGPDLEAVAQRTGLSPDDVVGLHCSIDYRVFMLGFAPGFPYLGTLPAALRLPRRDEPRLRVPPGSVAIAAAQTAVYPHATAGGWHLLGRTDAVLWDGSAAAALLQPGDRVRFVPV